MKSKQAPRVAMVLAGSLAVFGTVSAQTQPPTSTYYPPPSSQQQGTYYPPQNQQQQPYSQQQGSSPYTPASSGTLQGTVTQVVPVYDANIAMQGQQRRCYDQRTGGYTVEPMYPNGESRNGSYQTEPPERGTNAGRVMSSLLGGIIGGVLGSKVGGGMGSVIASSVGSTMGSMAGQAVYRNAKAPQGRTTVCEPIDVSESRAPNAYDVSYRIGTQVNTVRTAQSYRVGDPITVNVSVGGGY